MACIKNIEKKELTKKGVKQRIKEARVVRKI